MHIVLKWISPCLCSNTRFLLDSAFAGIYGNDCHSPPHTRTQTDRVCVGICARLLKRCCTPSCFKGLCSQAHHLSPCLHKSLSHPLSPSLSICCSTSLYISFSLPAPPSRIVSLTLLSSLTPLCLALSTTDYLAFIQNVIKENDQLPQLPPSFLPSALSSLFFMSLCLSSDPVLCSWSL